MIAHSIIDFYDDPHGSVLKNRISYEQLPDFVKTASYLTSEMQDRTPDDLYALVMVDNGRKLRKYACVDKGNTALSIIYFLENHDRLPEEAQKTAAVNLVQACQQFGMTAPPQLRKLAGLGTALNLGMNALYAKSLTEEGLKRHALQMAKGADVTGTDLMPKTKDTEKTASPYVDITGQQPSPRLVRDVPQPEDCCLVKEGQGQFPIRSYTEVQQASRYFDQYHQTMHPEDRHEYCMKLAARADQLGIPVSRTIEKYGSSQYAPDGEIKIAVHTRMQMWADDSPERDMLKSLLEKRAGIQPEIFCEALRLFDEQTGLHHHWDSAIYDPWYSTYGMTKKADWTFSANGEFVNENALRELSRNFKIMKDRFGCEIAQEFGKDPIGVFESLPLDTKTVIMRLANDPLGS